MADQEYCVECGVPIESGESVCESCEADAARKEHCDECDALLEEGRIGLCDDCELELDDEDMDEDNENEEEETEED